MAKRRKAPRPSAPSGPREVDPADARLHINTYEDVADSNDEFWAKQERIELNAWSNKRRKHYDDEDEFLEASDEEILAQDTDDDENPASNPTGKAVATLSDDDENQEHGEPKVDEGYWGASKREYFGADEIETEADALAEEAEARRLQFKQLSKMTDADFIFDESEWAAGDDKGVEAEGEADAMVEVLEDAVITDDMGPKDRYELLTARYPEYEFLADEFCELHPQLEAAREAAENKSSKCYEVVKYRILGCYIAALASYFAILTSPARDGDGEARTLAPAELREHEVIKSLMECRAAWQRVKKLKPVKNSSTDMLSPAKGGVDAGMAEDDKQVQVENKSKNKAAKTVAKAPKADAAAKRAQAIEESLADISILAAKPTKKTSKTTKTQFTQVSENDYSDFGEDDALDERTVADKARRKKSLRFYTSQIAQKAARRADAGRDAGGDADLPSRERLRDRQARLNAEAERRGKKNSKGGASLDDNESGSDDEAVAKELRDTGYATEYYDAIVSAAQNKKAAKAVRAEAASRKERLVPVEEVGENGKRKITWRIENNKGLAPKRRKEMRNPRVKKRMRYEEKQKKLRSMRPVYKGGEEKGGYQGEKSGIKPGLVASVKL